jgi:hypothetical protein
MLDAVIQNLIRQQRPYYQVQGSPIKGLDNQYWLLFKHRDADNLLKNIVSFLSFKGKQATHKLVRIDPHTAKIYTYSPRKPGDVPPLALLRTAKPTSIEKFLHLEDTNKEASLLAGSFREVKGLKRKFSLPEQLDAYNRAIAQMLERSVIYRRSTAYFDSGVLKLYEEPLKNIIQTEGKIHLLMDWQGFTKRADVAELEKLHNPEYRTRFAQRTLQEFLQGLEDSAFTSTEILAELVWLEFLQIRLIKMDQGRAIYHKKTGIFSDLLHNHILHEGSDNFTRAAHAKNAESVTFLYSWDSRLDNEAIAQSIQEFDQEWDNLELSFDLSQEFLHQFLAERDRRAQQHQPQIDTITPDEFTPGETTAVEINGQNLDQVDSISISDDELVEITITNQTPEQITAQIEVSAEHPPQPLQEFKVSTSKGTYTVQPSRPLLVNNVSKIPEFEEIQGFKQAVEMILAGQHGQPEDFLYWLAQQRPRQFRVAHSALLDDWVYQGVLFEHQKSGAQHCLRVMQDFGVAVCADAVGLGKTRLAAAVAQLYRQQNGQAKIAIIAAQKLHPNWEREMAELGFTGNHIDYELFNKNLMSRKGNGFLDNFSRYGGPDLIIIDEAHEGIRNYKSRIHKLCQQIRDRDQQARKQRHYLLLTATPWNNRREDIYNILQPFLTRPQGFVEAGFPAEVVQWFANRDIGVENFTQQYTEIFRRTYRELFLQRTRQMLRDAMPEMNVYARRQAEWLPVVFEQSTEQALEQIFTEFETSLYIPFADPIRYVKGSDEKRALLQNQRRFFLQRAESSMYALQRTIVNFCRRIEQMQDRLRSIQPDAAGLEQFLLLHYGLANDQDEKAKSLELDDREAWDEDYEEDEDDESDTDAQKEDKRQQLRRSIELAIAQLHQHPAEAQQIYERMVSTCESDLLKLKDIQRLLADEFVKDHKREQVTRKVQELVSQGHKVLLISTFSDTVLDYYRHMAQNRAIVQMGIGLAIGSTKRYYLAQNDQFVQIPPHNAQKGKQRWVGIKRQQFSDCLLLSQPVGKRHSDPRLQKNSWC